MEPTPAIPDHPASLNSIPMMIKADKGPTHNWCTIIDAKSNLETSLASRLTTLPDGVSPNAVLLSFTVL